MALRFLPSQNPIHTDASDCIVVGAFSDKTFSPSGTTLDAATGGRLKTLAERGDISGKTGQTVLLQDVPGVASARVLVIGLGDPEKFAVPQYLKAVADAVRRRVHGQAEAGLAQLLELFRLNRDYQDGLP